jgi:hypothetical protein
MHCVSRKKLLALLEQGGVDLATGAWAVDLLMLYVTAIVAERGNGVDPAAPEGAVARAVAAVSGRDYPHVHAARKQLLSGTGEERFAWALEVFLQGILQSPRSPKTRLAAASTKPRAGKKSRHAPLNEPHGSISMGRRALLSSAPMAL